MRALLISLLLMLEALGMSAALAQVAPFSMAPNPAAAVPAAPATRTGAQPGGMSTPSAPHPATQAPPLPFAMTPRENTAPFNPAQTESGAPAAAHQARAAEIAKPRGAGRLERPILPFELLRFSGEMDARSWVFHLTQDEASSSSTISVGYRNAIVVMPEASRLRIAINGESVIDTPIASAQDTHRVTARIRPGLLRAGQNIIRMEALQRHRTDCSIKATYELWTDVDSASTRLIFDEGGQKTLRSLEDLPAVGVDNAGVTTIRLIAPKIYRPEVRDRLLHLAQMVALRGRYAHPVIQVAETASGPSPVGTINVIMGIASELRGIVASLPDAASSQPLAIMVPEPGSGGTTMVVSGPTWSDLDTAINIVGAPVLGAASFERTAIDTASWHWPDAPSALGRRSFRFSDLGIPTQEFSGRRLTAGFVINLPADFYATEYAEAVLSLDAAYTSSVKAGSHVSIYVNDRISSTMTITSQGNFVRQHPIRIPMRNFKAGINHVMLEAVLLTDSDERCAPGETLSETKRFVLFDSSTFDTPEFGRIGRAPDLAVLSAGSFPYGYQSATFVLARLDALNYSAAGTLLARMARDAGMPVRAQFSNAAASGDQSVVFIGAVDQIPSGLLSRVKVSENLRMLWPSTPHPVASGDRQLVASAEFTLPTGPMSLDRSALPITEEVRKRWAESLQRRGIVNEAVLTIGDWMERTFNLSLASLSLHDRADAAYEPPQRSTLLMAQNHAGGTGTWTLVTARTDEALAAEMARLTSPTLWSQVAGRAVALDPSEAKLAIEPVGDYTFVQTQHFSLENLRLVAANWMSNNILYYALFIVVCCTLLGIATHLLLSRLGRPS